MSKRIQRRHERIALLTALALLWGWDAVALQLLLQNGTFGAAVRSKPVDFVIQRLAELSTGPKVDTIKKGRHEQLDSLRSSGAPLGGGGLGMAARGGLELFKNAMMV